MIVTPSDNTFNRLVHRAMTGEYIPYTNGDQDVIEWEYPAHLFAQDPRLAKTGRMDEIFKHLHFLGAVEKSSQCNEAAFASLENPTCADFASRCSWWDKLTKRSCE